MYSDMSKRTSSTPVISASCRVNLGLADTGGTGEQERAHGPLLVVKARARHLDGRGERSDRLVLAEDHELQIAIEMLEHVAVGGRYGLRRNPRHPGNDVLDQLDVNDLGPMAHGLQRQFAPASSMTSMALSGR